MSDLRVAPLVVAIGPTRMALLRRIAAAAAPGRVALVGGAVRDLLLRLPVHDLDVAIEGDALDVADQLAAGGQAEVRRHPRFGTATVGLGAAGRVDLARCRRERYPSPGALPDVEPATLEEDLGRRDFAAHAIALVIPPDEAPPSLLDPFGGIADLGVRILRILRGDAFVDDPTRMLRAVRYAARLRFALDERAEAAFQRALQADAVRTVSSDRLRREWDLLTAEHRPEAQLAALLDAGLHTALGLPTLPADDLARRAGAVRTGLQLLGDRIGPGDAYLCGWIHDADEATRELALTRLAVPTTRHARFRTPELPGALDDPIACYEALSPLRPTELVALCASAHPGALAAARRFLDELSLVRPLVGGRDLLAMGVPEGPRVRTILREVFHQQLIGGIDDRGAALAFARTLVDRGEQGGGDRLDGCPGDSDG